MNAIFFGIAITALCSNAPVRAQDEQPFVELSFDQGPVRVEIRYAEIHDQEGYDAFLEAEKKQEKSDRAANPRFTSEVISLEPSEGPGFERLPRVSADRGVSQQKPGFSLHEEGDRLARATGAVHHKATLTGKVKSLAKRATSAMRSSLKKVQSFDFQEWYSKPQEPEDPEPSNRFRFWLGTIRFVMNSYSVSKVYFLSHPDSGLLPLMIGIPMGALSALLTWDSKNAVKWMTKSDWLIRKLKLTKAWAKKSAKFTEPWLRWVLLEMGFVAVILSLEDIVGLQSLGPTLFTSLVALLVSDLHLTAKGFLMQLPWDIGMGIGARKIQEKLATPEEKRRVARTRDFIMAMISMTWAYATATATHSGEDAQRLADTLYYGFGAVGFVNMAFAYKGQGVLKWIDRAVKGCSDALRKLWGENSGSDSPQAILRKKLKDSSNSPETRPRGRVLLWGKAGLSLSPSWV